MTNQPFEVSIEDIKQSFKNHIQPDHNSRIIFSGEYGIGKTYFLRNFFKKEMGYAPIFISPVKYSVSDNIDVFELIKVDILIQLIIRGDLELENEFELNSYSDLALLYLTDKNKLLENIIGLSSLVNSNYENETSESMVKLISFFALVKDKLDGFKKTLTKKYESKNYKIIDYFNSIKSQKGSPYEMDFISQFINKVLENRIKNGKNVLIIDDIDRLDPEHVFRILNILSVHNDNLLGTNKFKFDKIILVFDLENIRKMFAHRYGEKVDFDGYIDKFYSTNIFKFSNVNALISFIGNSKSFRLSPNARGLLKYILIPLVRYNKINIRKILKLEYIEYNDFPIYEARINSDDGKLYPLANSSTLPILSLRSSSDFFMILKCLKNLFGSKEALLESVAEMENKREGLRFDLPEYRKENLIKILALPYHTKIKNGLNSHSQFGKFYHRYGLVLEGYLSGFNYKIMTFEEATPNIDIRTVKVRDYEVTQKHGIDLRHFPALVFKSFFDTAKFSPFMQYFGDL